MEREAIHDSKRLKAYGIGKQNRNVGFDPTNVRRYYDRGRTVHSYFSPETGRGERIGNYEGVAFMGLGKVGLGDTIPTGTKLLVLFTHPQKLDFVMLQSDHLYTKNDSEDANNGYAFEGFVGWVN